MPFNPGNKRAQRARNVPTVGGPMKFGLYPTVGVSLPFLLKLTRCCGPKNAACSGKREAVVACGASVQVCKACNVPLTCPADAPRGSCVSQEDIHKQVYPVVKGSCEPAGFAPRYCRDCCDKVKGGPGGCEIPMKTQAFQEALAQLKNDVDTNNTKEQEELVNCLKAEAGDLDATLKNIYNADYCSEDNAPLRPGQQDQVISAIVEKAKLQTEKEMAFAKFLLASNKIPIDFELKQKESELCIEKLAFISIKKEGEDAIAQAKATEVDSVQEAEDREKAVAAAEKRLADRTTLHFARKNKYESEIEDLKADCASEEVQYKENVAEIAKMVPLSKKLLEPVVDALTPDERDVYIGEILNSMSKVGKTYSDGVFKNQADNVSEGCAVKDPDAAPENHVAAPVVNEPV